MSFDQIKPPEGPPRIWSPAYRCEVCRDSGFRMASALGEDGHPKPGDFIYACNRCQVGSTKACRAFPRWYPSPTGEMLAVGGERGRGNPQDKTLPPGNLRRNVEPKL